jgi:hypothetical protein
MSDVDVIVPCAGQLDLLAETLLGETPVYKRARSGQPETAMVAAEANRAQRGRIRDRVAEVLRARGDHGATDDELLDCCRHLTSDRSSVAKRRGEWGQLGHVVDSGQRRTNPNGIATVSWVWVEHPPAPGVPDSTPFLHVDRPYCPMCGMSARFRWAGCTATFHDDAEERRSAMSDGWV